MSARYKSGKNRCISAVSRLK